MPSTSKPRLEWVDAAKGMTIVLVVLNHACMYAEIVGAGSDTWAFYNDMLRTLRMPLFFALAGLFASSWIRRSWPELLRGKVLLLMWVYAVWVVIRFVFFSFVPSLAAPNEAASIWRLLIQAVWSSMPTWFLYALAVFFVGAKLLNRVPVWAQFVGSGVLAVVFMSDIVSLPSSLWNGLGDNFAFFLAGLHASTLIRAVMEDRRGRALACAFIPVWVLAAWSAVEVGWIDALGGRFLVAVLAIPAGIALGLLLSWSKSLRYMGENTMPIYLVHTLIQGGLAVWLQTLPPAMLASWAPWLPVSLVVVSMAGSLLLHWAVLAVGLHGVFTTPRWLDRFVAPSASPMAPASMR